MSKIVAYLVSRVSDYLRDYTYQLFSGIRFLFIHRVANVHSHRYCINLDADTIAGFINNPVLDPVSDQVI